MNQGPENRESLSSRLRIARKLSGLSQGQVAALLKCQRPTVSEMESGRRRVAVDELVALAEIYGVSVEWLAKGAKENANTEDVLTLAAKKLERMHPDDLRRVVDVLSLIEDQRRGG